MCVRLWRKAACVECALGYRLRVHDSKDEAIRQHKQLIKTAKIKNVEVISQKAYMYTVLWQ